MATGPSQVGSWFCIEKSLERLENQILASRTNRDEKTSSNHF